MKQSVLIWVIVAMLVSCGRPSVETGLEPSPLHQDLSAIDSLMWDQPDSAFAMLLDFVESSEVDSLDEFNDHYCQLLISELLYKNDYGQSNREDLLRAMEYFDTLADAKGASLQRDVFLSARAHYMNGVGYYEMDSVVPACAEYLKALEIMENHYEDEDFIGFKAKFMALVYTHLCGLFSEQRFHQQAIYFGKHSLPYYYAHAAEQWHIAWVLDEISIHYGIMERWDSAYVYCDRAINILPDTIGLTYRDLAALRSLLLFNNGKENSQKTLKCLRRLLFLAEDRQEYLARCFHLGELFYYDHIYDSAWVYATKVFEESDDIGQKKQAAERLVEICKYQGKNPEVYVDFLVPYATIEEKQSEIKSQLTELYSGFCQKQQNRQGMGATKENIWWNVIIFIGFLGAILVVVFAYHRKQKKNETLNKQIVEKQPLLNLECFLEESLCREILFSIQHTHIKRSSVPSDYPEHILSEARLQQLARIVNHYFGSFETRLEQQGIKPNPCLVNLCHLYLLGLNEKQISILLNRDYSTIKRYEKKLKKGFKTQRKLVGFFRNIVLNN